MKRLLLLLALMLIPSIALANESAQGWCESGAQPVVTSGLQSTTQVQASYPRCVVSVNITGGGAATLFADSAGTPLSNPFTANDPGGRWQFYAVNGHYTITLSGGLNGGFPSPVTYSDILLNDPTGGSPATVFQVNGVTLLSSSSVNFINGTNITVSNPSAGNVQFAFSGTLPINLGGTGATSFAAAFLPVFVGTPVTNDCVKWLSLTSIGDAGGPCSISAGGTTNSAAQFSVTYYSAAGTSNTLSGAVAPTAPALVPQSWVTIPVGGLATVPSTVLPGVAVRVVSGITSTDAITSTDCIPKRVTYNTSVSVAVALPTPTTLAVPNCSLKLVNNTSGVGTMVTVTPAGGGLINGFATLQFPDNIACTIYVDSNPNWDADCSGGALANGPVKRILLWWAFCSGGGSPVASLMWTAAAANSGAGAACTADNQAATLSLADADAYYVDGVLPSDWQSFGPFTFTFLTTDSNTAHTVITSLAAYCVAPPTSPASGPAYNTASSTTTTLAAGAGQYAVTILAPLATGCSPGAYYRLKFTRTTDTATNMLLTGWGTSTYNGTFQ